MKNIGTHKSLGRGLGSIISAGLKKPQTQSAKATAAAGSKQTTKEAAPQTQAVQGSLFSEILIEKISASPYQARKEFSEEQIAQLADSIVSEGLIQPIVVRKMQEGYELIAGERRLRACKKIGLKRITAIVQTSSDSASAVSGLIENLQRSDLNPMEEANGIASLIANFKLTQEAVSKRIGKSRTAVTNSLRLLSLPVEIQSLISQGLLSQGHAKVLMSLDDAAHQLILARKIIGSQLSVRNTEDAVKRIKNDRDRLSPTTAKGSAAQDAVVRDIQNKIAGKLNAKVELRHAPKHGKIIIDYYGNDDLQRILEVFGVEI